MIQVHLEALDSKDDSDSGGSQGKRPQPSACSTFLTREFTHENGNIAMEKFPHFKTHHGVRVCEHELASVSSFFTLTPKTPTMFSSNSMSKITLQLADDQVGSLRSIAWNPLGTLIAAGSADKTLRVWNPDRPNVKYSTELKGHLAPIEKVAFNPVKDAELCSVSSDGVVKFWDVRTKAVINEVKGLGDAFTLAWAPDGGSLVVGNKGDNIFVLSPTQSTPIASHQQNVQTNQMAFCWGGKKIFLTTGEGRVKILSYPEFKPIFHLSYDPSTPFTLNGHTSSCMSIEMQPTARWLATGGSDSIIAMWDTTDWICQRTLIDMTGPVRSISFSFDGSFIVGGSDEGSGLEIAHAETGEYVHTVKTAGPCPIVVWHPTRYCLAYADVGTLKIIGVDPERR